MQLSFPTLDHLWLRHCMQQLSICASCDNVVGNAQFLQKALFFLIFKVCYNLYNKCDM